MSRVHHVIGSMGAPRRVDRVDQRAGVDPGPGRPVSDQINVWSGHGMVHVEIILMTMKLYIIPAQQ